MYKDIENNQETTAVKGVFFSVLLTLGCLSWPFFLAVIQAWGAKTEDDGVENSAHQSVEEKLRFYFGIEFHLEGIDKSQWIARSSSGKF